jgi:fatty-acyl-CoA synthase
MANLSYAQGPSASLWNLTQADVLAQTAARFPEREALIVRHQDVRLTWREFDQEVTRVAHGLAGLGLCSGDRVGNWASNCVEWLLVQYACARAGYVLVNVNPAYRSDELAYILQRSGMKALFLRERDARANYQEILDGARCPDQALAHVIHLVPRNGTPCSLTDASFLLHLCPRTTPPIFNTPLGPPALPKACCSPIAAW